MCLLCGIPIADLDLIQRRNSCGTNAIYAGFVRLVQQALLLRGKCNKLTGNEIIELDRSNRPPVPDLVQVQPKGG
jgi:hypothetical protein